MCIFAQNMLVKCDHSPQNRTSLIPIEIKSGTRLSGKSLGIYIERYGINLALRYSMNNLKTDAKILNIPLFLADWTKKILDYVPKKL